VGFFHFYDLFRAPPDFCVGLHGQAAYSPDWTGIESDAVRTATAASPARKSLGWYLALSPPTGRSLRRAQPSWYV